TNFSCRNVSTCDGQLYQNPQDAGLVANMVREAIPPVPYLAKIGHVQDEDSAAELLDALTPFVDAFAMTNSVAALVQTPDGDLLFDGKRRGICGDATRSASKTQAEMFARLIAARGDKTRVIGVGGISSADHVQEYLQSGAEAVQIATAAMVDPTIGLKIRQALATNES
ncbi:MAG: hypothetical protein KDA84_05575, partial [Planctomycetaceae bacterium]|nr:hypothetical protein [Planctomycetaceae bacterium]